MTPFSATLRKASQSGSLAITIPKPIADQLRATGFYPPGWVRFCISDRTIFGFLRFPFSRPSASFTVPRWACENLRPRKAYVCSVEEALPYRARPSDAIHDWLRHVPFGPQFFTTAEDENLVLHSRLEAPVTFPRHPTSFPDQLLAKGISNTNFALSSTNPETLHEWASELKKLFPHDICLEVRQHKNARAASAIEFARVVDVPCIRIRTSEHQKGILGVLRIPSETLHQIIRERLRAAPREKKET